MSKELTLEILDDAIKSVEAVHSGRVTKIYLNPDDWEKALQKKTILAGKSNALCNMAFGIPVILSPTLDCGMFIMEGAIID